MDSRLAMYNLSGYHVRIPHDAANLACAIMYCSYRLNSLPSSLGGANNTGESINKFLRPNVSCVHSACYYRRSVNFEF